LGTFKEFLLETTGKNYSHELNTLLKICKLQQSLLKEVSNEWNPDVQSKIAEIDKTIVSLENYTKVKQ